MLLTHGAVQNKKTKTKTKTETETKQNKTKKQKLSFVLFSLIIYSIFHIKTLYSSKKL